jgi:hypothetical protein
LVCKLFQSFSTSWKIIGVEDTILTSTIWLCSSRDGGGCFEADFKPETGTQDFEALR